jgi:hypothetical protein
VHYDNSLLVHSRYSSDQVIAIVPRVKVVAITNVFFDGDIALSRVRVDAHNGDVGLLGCGGALLGVVISRGGEGCPIFLGLGFDGIQWGNEVL